MKRILVAASGKGSNFKAIIDSEENGKSYLVVGLFCNRPKAGVIELARESKIPALIESHKKYDSREQHEEKLLGFFKEIKADYLVLAGYMRILSPHFSKSLKKQVINIHPSLLPDFKGSKDAIKDAFERKVSKTGITIHWVDEEVDGGEIIEQQSVIVEKDDNLLKLREKIHRL